MSDSFMIRYSSPAIRTSVPDHLPNRMRSPARTSSGCILPVSSRATRTDCDHLAFLGLLLGVVGNDDAAGCPVIALDPANDDAVMQGTKIHALPPDVGSLSLALLSKERQESTYEGH